MTNDLKTCPFCGGKAELNMTPVYYQNNFETSGWFVQCLKGCCNQTIYFSDHDAVENWNRRVEPVPDQNAYDQGRISGRVEMRTKILESLKNLVGSEVWNNI